MTDDVFRGFRPGHSQVRSVCHDDNAVPINDHETCVRAVHQPPVAFLAHAQRSLCLLAFGDVPARADYCNRQSIAVPEKFQSRFNMNRRAILAYFLRLYDACSVRVMVGVFLLLNHRFHVAHNFCVRLPRQRLVEGERHRLLRRVAAHFFDRWTEICEPARLQIHYPDDVRGVLGQHPVFLLALEQAVQSFRHDT